MPDSAIPAEARMHTNITRRVRFVAKSVRTDWDVYMATYTTGRGGQPYQRAEEQSGDEFWSIKAYEHEPSRESRVKDPDVIIVQADRVRCMIEVKWGTVSGNPKSDLRLSPDEQEKMIRLMAGPVVCRVSGPAVKGGHRYRNSEFPRPTDYRTDDQTKLILVSDFMRTKTSLPAEFGEFLNLATRMKAIFLAADIDSRVGDIPSLSEILEAYSPTTAT